MTKQAQAWRDRAHKAEAELAALRASAPHEPSEEAQVAALQAYERFGVALSDSGLFRKIKEMLGAAYAVDRPRGDGAPK